ncbi:MAG: CdaR family protein [Anaerolineaceae bacterium]|nr:CdaR family protein [Anaerolineaceae bacterium]
MPKALRSFAKTLPLLITAIILAIAVWVMAVTSSDPSVERVYPTAEPVEIVGQRYDLVITVELHDNVSLILRAPTSIWTSLTSQKVLVRAIMDLSGLGEGEHTVPIQIQIGIRPVEIRSYAPRSASVQLQTLETRTFDIRVINQGSVAVGFQSNPAEMSETSVLVSGAKSFVGMVSEVRAVVKLTDAKTDINQTITLQAVDANGSVVKDVSLSPEKITITQKVVERGGYRNVVVKVVTNGQPAPGFRLSSIPVYPPTVTVFSSDPALIDALPGFIETNPIDLSKKTESFEEEIGLNLPVGIQVIDDPSVLVRVEITPIITSLSISDVLVEAIGLNTKLEAIILPDKVDIIVSGPLNILETLDVTTLRVLLDLSEYKAGTYTLEPEYSLNIPNVKIESISPTTFKVTIK